MSGHSHWAGIKHKKAKEDARRGKTFSRVAKQIMTAVRHGGKDADMNLDLKYAIEAAKAVNMPKDNIERAILKGAGELEGSQLEAVRFEGYGPGGAAVMVDALTDNRNRTTPNMRKIFGDHAGQLAAGGSVSWSFETRGLILLAAGGRSEEELFEIAIEAGADDFQQAGDDYEVSCDARSLHAVRDALREAGLEVESAEVTMVPQSYVDLSVDDGRKVLKMMEDLENDEDVTAVYSNFNLPPELMAELDDA
ncbi:MAG: YebC/PmpR family DNA-binding transcriptional regulator [Candidatus Brocadiaceae bacterium]|nr:YebC/PmpR family DNA-binding transcriptional regulator [Candidatus Brocadiaceae bacterium]